MVMKKYKYRDGEKLTEVRVNKVWLKEYMMSKDSDFNSMFPDFWEAINDEINVQFKGFLIELEGIKNLIRSGQEMYIIFIKTESELSDHSTTIGQRAYLTNGNEFIDITWLMLFTNLCGCQFQKIPPPFEDFINEFVGEVYF